MSKYFLIASFLLFCVGSRAQTPDVKFDHIGVKEGLPENQVKALKQDSYGYLWMGTQNGIVRYDGYNYKVYQLGTSKVNKLALTSINSIFEDAEKRLWVSTFENGIFRYDTATDSFTQFPFPAGITSLNFIDEDHHQNLWCRNQTNGINTILKFATATGKWELFGINSKGANHIDAKLCYPPCLTADGTVWLPSGNGLYKYNGPGKKLTAFFTTTDTAKTTAFNPVYEAPSQPGILWMNVYHGYNERLKIARFAYRNNTIKYYVAGKAPGEPASADIYTIYEDKKSRLWFCTNLGLSKLDRATDRFTNYQKSDTGKNAFFRALETPKGNFWLTSSQGLEYFNASSGEFKLYNGDDAPPQVNDKILDNTGQLWVGSSGGGFKTNYLRSAFHIFKSVPGKADSYPGDLHTIAEADSASYYTGSGGSVYLWTPATARFKLLLKTTHTDFNDICRGENDLLYVATDHGLKVYSLRTKKELPLSSITTDVKTVENVAIRSFCRDQSGLIWMSPFGHGVFSFNPATKKITQYPFKKGSNLGDDHNNDGRLDDAVVITMYVDRQNTLWVGTNNGGVNRFDRATGKFYSYHTKKNQAMFCITNIHQDNAGRMWIGTYLNGLFQLDPKAGRTLRHLDQQSGLMHNEVFSINEDAAGHLILINQRGITRYEPATGKIQNFKIGTLFPGSDMGADGMSAQRPHNGAIVFALNDGFVQFHPAALAPNATPPIIHIENISVSDPLRNDSSKNIIPFGLKTLELPYNQNRIKFDYIALHFDDPSQNKYAYRLDGYDKGWTDAGTLRSVTYTNLSPGTYTFHVKAANSDGIWNDAGESLVVVIHTALWMRWWAWLIYVILFAAAIYGFINYRSRVLKRENQLLEEKITERTHQLSEANKELNEKQEEIITQRDQLADTVTELKNTQQQLVQSEKLASLGELTAGIAHEIQNPLNFVNNFSEVSAELVDEMQEELQKGDIEEAIAISADIKTNLEKIRHHGLRADGIVKNMLQHSRASTGEKQLTDINNLADEYLRLSYHGLRAKDKSFNSDMRTQFDANLPKLNIAQQDIGRVLLNIYNNAFYAVQQKAKTAGKDYKPLLTVTTSLKNKHVEINITDNGTGMTEHVKEKIMQPFFTTKPTGEGTGLGLSLSYDIVVKGHGGNITVDTRENEFTEFIISLPVN